ncbi:MAG: RpiB/LacA/LacB family sugar-phosphate isomerase [Clostridia bacterium]|nr:RpiB/LacA/LacB family sugar-phosphate isomerase [Clostridia bacterium]
MIILASDHAGFDLKILLMHFFKKNGIEYVDAGALDYDENDDYPDIVKPAVKQVLADPNNRGIFVCGSGIGMCMSANRHKGIRAVCAYDSKTAKLARKDEDANVLCLGARRTNKGDAIKIILRFLTSPFEGGRHQRRIDKF